MNLQEELKKIQGRSKVLKPSAVVEAAKAKDHPLHEKFEWDNSKAGEQWRLHQARQLIRSVVIETHDSSPQIVRAFVSLQRDRIESGYRDINKVMEDKDLKLELIQEAKRDFERMKIKYKILTELSGVWDQVDRILG